MICKIQLLYIKSQTGPSGEERGEENMFKREMPRDESNFKYMKFG
jgi:hypothetical protein